MHFIRLIIWKEFRQIRSDRLTIRLMIVPIIVQMFILGYAITTEVKNTTVTVVDRSNTPVSRQLVQDIFHNPLLRPAPSCGSEEEARRMIDRGDARLAVIIPPDFALRLSLPGAARIGMMIDGQDANSSTVAAGYLNSIIGQWSTVMLRRKLAISGIQVANIVPVEIRTAILFNPMLKSTWYMIPALAVVLVTMITSLLSSLSIVKERTSGTLEQLMVTPISPVHIVLGKAVPYLIIGLFQLFAVLGIATLWFGVPFHGNLLELVLFGIIYMTSTLGIGILVSTIARNPQQVMFMLWFLLIFFLMLSGFFLALENMPQWVQKVTRVNPLRYFMFILREMFLKGSGVADLWRDGLAMMGIGAVVFGTAILAFKRKVS